MKKHLFGFAIAGLAFLAGFAPLAPSPDEGLSGLSTDFDTYRIELGDLAVVPNSYDGKIIHLTGSFRKMQDYDIGIVEDGRFWMRAVCVAEWSGCEALFRPRGSEYLFDRQAKIEVIGRFRSGASDPHPRQRGEKVRLLEIHKVLAVEPQWDTTPGGGHTQGPLQD